MKLKICPPSSNTPPAIGVAVGVLVRVGVAVAVGVLVRVGVRVGVAVFVAVADGIRVGVALWVGVGVALAVWVAVTLAAGVLVAGASVDGGAGAVLSPVQALTHTSRLPRKTSVISRRDMEDHLWRASSPGEGK